MACTANCPQVSQEFAQKLFNEGAFIVMFNVPPGTEIGIDLHSWNVGPKFKGIKMIPPGLHYIYYSAVSKQGQTAPRTGFFYEFEKKEVLVKTYINDTEDFTQASPEEVECIRANIRNLDRDLGCYPLDSWRRWFSLSQHLTGRYVDAVIPANGIVSSVPAMVPVDSPTHSSTANSDARKKLKTAHSAGTDICSSETMLANMPDTETSEKLHSTNESNQNGTDYHSQFSEDSKPNEITSPFQTIHKDGTIFLTNNDNDDLITEASDLSSNTIGSTASLSISSAPRSSNDAAHNRPSTVTGSAAESSYTSDGLPELVPAPGTEWRWHDLPKRSYRQGASPAEMTASSIDSSYLLTTLMGKMNSPEDIVSELQLSFVSFLVGQSWSGWDRWKRLLDVLCRAERALLQHPDLYSKAMAALHFQIQEVPEDLFVDIVEQENFLAASLSCLFANVADNSECLPSTLVDRANKFKRHLTKHFGWQLDIDGNEEDAPVVVQL